MDSLEKKTHQRRSTSSANWTKTVKVLFFIFTGFTLYTLCYPDVVRDNKTGVCLRDFIEDNG